MSILASTDPRPREGSSAPTGPTLPPDLNAFGAFRALRPLKGGHVNGVWLVEDGAGAPFGAKTSLRSAAAMPASPPCPRLVARLRAAWTACADAPVGPIHGDLCAGNLIVTPGGPALIDGDEARSDFRFLDEIAARPATPSGASAHTAFEIAARAAPGTGSRPQPRHGVPTGNPRAPPCKARRRPDLGRNPIGRRS